MFGCYNNSEVSNDLDPQSPAVLYPSKLFFFFETLKMTQSLLNMLWVGR